MKDTLVENNSKLIRYVHTHFLALWKWKLDILLSCLFFCPQMKEMTCRDVVKEVAKM